MMQGVLQKVGSYSLGQEYHYITTFMDLEGLLSCSQRPALGSYLESVEFTSSPHTLFP